MRPEEFRSLLDTYGADLTRWPHARRQQAHRYMQDSAQARDIFAEAQEFDALLSVSEPILSSHKRGDLLDSIMDSLPEETVADSKAVDAKKGSTPPFTPSPKPDRPGLTGLLGGILVRPAAPVFAACFACGILIGAGLYVKHQSVVVSAVSMYSEPISLYDLN